MRPIKRLNIDQLINIAKENRKSLYVKDVSEELDEAARFVLALDIREGKYKIFSSLVHEAYQLWSNKKVSFDGFCRKFSRMFKSDAMNINDTTKRYYKLNYRPAELLKEAAKMKAEYD